MPLRFASLGSGSKGNATIVESGHALLMIDCGFSIKETKQRLLLLGHNLEDINAILVTHEHSDHIKGVGPLARKYKIPVYLTHGTSQYKGLGKLPECNIINLQRGFQIEDIDITPVAIPHDAREPCQFVFRHNKKTLGLLTDIGSITAYVTEQYQHCDALMLECNHCPHLLSIGPYPYLLKQRVGGQWGHLSNQQAANLLRYIQVDQLQHLVISHISEKNNTQVLAREAITQIYGDKDSLILADQQAGVNWLAVV